MSDNSLVIWLWSASCRTLVPGPSRTPSDRPSSSQAAPPPASSPPWRVSGADGRRSRSRTAQLTGRPVLYGQSPYKDYGFQRVWLKQNLKFKGWNSQAHREFPGKFESSNLSRDNLSRETGRSYFYGARPGPKSTNPLSPNNILNSKWRDKSKSISNWKTSTTEKAVGDGDRRVAVGGGDPRCNMIRYHFDNM